MAKRGLSVAVSWDEEVVTVADDSNLPNVKKRIIGITYDIPYDGKAAVKKRLGKLWMMPLADWPWPDKAPAMRRKERRRA